MLRRNTLLYPRSIIRRTLCYFILKGLNTLENGVWRLGGWQGGVTVAHGNIRPHSQLNSSRSIQIECRAKIGGKPSLSIPFQSQFTHDYFQLLLCNPGPLSR